MVAETVLTQENIEKILKGITIPSPPQVVADLQMEMAMPDPDLNDMDYMLGLFHNTGIPLLMQRFADYPEVLAQSYLLEEHRIVDAENKHYKSNHAVVSFYAARSWKLPKMLCQVIAEHHNAIDIFTEKDKTNSDEKYLLAILKLGEHIAGLHRIIGNNDSDLEWQQIQENVLEYLGLSQHDCDDLVSYAADNGIGGQTYFM